MKHPQGKVCRICRCDTFSETYNPYNKQYNCCGCSISFIYIDSMFVDPLDLPRKEPTIREIIQLKDAIDGEIKRREKL